MDIEAPIQGSVENDLLVVNGLTLLRRQRRGLVEPVVRHVSFSVGAGEMVSLAGETGCGHDTILTYLAGVEEPGIKRTDGTVRWHPLMGAGVRHARVSVRAPVVLTADASCHYVPGTKMRSWLGKWARSVGGGASDTPGSAWSQAFQAVGLVEPEQLFEMDMGSLPPLVVHKLMLARAVLARVPLVIGLDPGGDLDEMDRLLLGETMRELGDEEGISFLLSMNDARWVSLWSDRVLFFYEGGLLQAFDQPERMEESPHPYIREWVAATPSIKRSPGVLSQISREAALKASFVIGRRETGAASGEGD